MIRRRSFAAVIAGALALSSCTPFFAPQRDPSRFFALSVDASSAGATDAASPARAGRTYAVGTVQLPEYLDRNTICVRLSETEISFSRTHRWAAPLRDAFPSVLAQNLALLLDGDRVLVHPWTTEHPDVRIEIQVRHFETHADGEGRLVARWTLRDGTGGRALLVRDSTHVRRSDAGDPGSAVAALSGVLADLAAEIAAALRELP